MIVIGLDGDGFVRLFNAEAERATKLKAAR